MKVVVIGSGIAGLTAAIQCDKKGDEVSLFAKTDLKNSSSSWAQGGVAYEGENDSPTTFAADIQKAGAGMNRMDVVKAFAENAPIFLKQFLMDTVKVPFQKSNDGGEYSLTGEAGHSKKRIIYSHDNTGEVIIDSLSKYLIEHTKVKLYENCTVLDLINIPHHSNDPLSVYQQVQTIGVYVLRNETEKDDEPTVERFFADKIILATGGIGQIYKNNTNPIEATGDGVAMAYRSGARVINMEFTQFHPTTLFSKGKKVLLISEALRGEGAIVVNQRGEDFLSKKHKKGSLAPRDIVSRLIVQEQIRTREDHVFLRLPDSLKKIIKERFPNIYKKCLERNVDISKQDIPVTPAFHYCCGGILTDMEGRTSVPNLFAVGECACSGIHGANRLASTSLLEGLFLANKAAEASVERLQNYDKNRIKQWDAHSKQKSISRLIHFSKVL